jgi:hypothetical protein
MILHDPNVRFQLKLGTQIVTVYMGMEPFNTIIRVEIKTVWAT